MQLLAYNISSCWLCWRYFVSLTIRMRDYHSAAADCRSCSLKIRVMLTQDGSSYMNVELQMLLSMYSILSACSLFSLFCAKSKSCCLMIQAMVKGSLTRDFRLQVFFINQCPSGPWVSHWDHFKFFRKFPEIFVNECLSAVSTTPAKKEKNFKINFFSYFVES